MTEMVCSAVISRCETYRYLLSRSWEPRKRVVWIMLNPSTADARLNDPTIRKCIGFARHWGIGGIDVLNLFAYRTSKPVELRKAYMRHLNIIGGDNDDYIRRIVADNRQNVVCAWGVHGTLLGRDVAVKRILRSMGVQPRALDLTKDGHPRHPLYVPYEAKPVPF